MSPEELESNPAPRLLNVPKLAAYLGVPVRTAQWLIYNRRVPVVLVGRRTYADRISVDAWLKDHTITPVAAARATRSILDNDGRDGAK